MEELFNQWIGALESKPDFWGVRWCRGREGGVLWRNRAAREAYAVHGFFPSALLPWPCLRQWLPNVEEVEQAYVEVFESQMLRLVCDARVTGFEPARSLNVFNAAAGTIENGLVVIHWRPCVSGELFRAGQAVSLSSSW